VRKNHFYFALYTPEKLLAQARKRGNVQEPQQRALRRHICALCPEIDAAQKLGRGFVELLRERKADALDGWLRDALQSAVVELNTFARGLQRDEAAVRHALALPWSNGQVEGQVNRLKLVKRQMYGRAKFDLLRLRVLANA
jgi:transposase